jgi:hypothetical protein
MNSLERGMNGHKTKSLLKIVRQTLRRHRGFFTAKALAEFIGRSRHGAFTESDFRHPLRTLRKLGEIRLVEKGSGRKPHLYLKF